MRFVSFEKTKFTNLALVISRFSTPPPNIADLDPLRVVALYDPNQERVEITVPYRADDKRSQHTPLWPVRFLSEPVHMKHCLTTSDFKSYTDARRMLQDQPTESTWIVSHINAGTSGVMTYQQLRYSQIQVQNSNASTLIGVRSEHELIARTFWPVDGSSDVGFKLVGGQQASVGVTGYPYVNPALTPVSSPAGLGTTFVIKTPAGSFLNGAPPAGNGAALPYMYAYLSAQGYVNGVRRLEASELAAYTYEFGSAQKLDVEFTAGGGTGEIKIRTIPPVTSVKQTMM